jgi:O-antigen/teichoic acid export membrane protein
MAKKSDILRGSVTSLVMKVSGLLLATLFAFAVARTLGAAAWGEFSLSLSLIMFTGILAAAGFDTFLLKTSAARAVTEFNDTVYQRTIRISIIVSVITGSILFLSAPVIASSFFHNPGLTLSFKIASFAILPHAFLNINAGLLQGFKELKKYVFIRFVSHHAGGLLLFLILLLVYKENHSVILAYTLSLYLFAGLSYLWTRKARSLTTGQTNTKTAVSNTRTLLMSGFPFMLAALLFFMKGWIDTIMIGVFMNETDVGIYNITLKLTAVLGITLSAVSAVSTPLYSEAYASGDIQKLKEHVSKSSAIVFYTSLPVFLILILFPGPILSLFGDEFTAGTTALIILAAGGFINAYFGAAGYLMNMTGSEVVLQYITLAAVLIGIALNYALIPLYGLTGAAGATTITIAGWNSACALYIQRVYSVHVFYIPGVRGTVRKWIQKR